MHCDSNNYEAAEKEHKEALEIYRKISEKNPETYENFLAMTLNNLGYLHLCMEKYDKAEREYCEALKLYERFFYKYPTAFENDVNTIKDNLKELLETKNKK